MQAVFISLLLFDAVAATTTWTNSAAGVTVEASLFGHSSVFVSGSSPSVLAGMMLLFGGCSNPTELYAHCVFSDKLYAFDLFSRSFLEVETCSGNSTPSARVFHTATLDPGSDVMLIHGGTGQWKYWDIFGADYFFVSESCALNDVWAFNLISLEWTELKEHRGLPCNQDNAASLAAPPLLTFLTLAFMAFCNC